jgi:hypothetical protein
VQELLLSLKKIFFLLCVVAFLINVGLYGFASYIEMPDAQKELQILSIVNMILLSFILLKDPKQK